MYLWTLAKGQSKIHLEPPLLHLGKVTGESVGSTAPPACISSPLIKADRAYPGSLCPRQQLPEAQTLAPPAGLREDFP